MRLLGQSWELSNEGCSPEGSLAPRNKGIFVLLKDWELQNTLGSQCQWTSWCEGHRAAPGSFTHRAASLWWLHALPPVEPNLPLMSPHGHRVTDGIPCLSIPLVHEHFTSRRAGPSPAPPCWLPAFMGTRTQAGLSRMENHLDRVEAAQSCCTQAGESPWALRGLHCQPCSISRSLDLAC